MNINKIINFWGEAAILWYRSKKYVENKAKDCIIGIKIIFSSE